MIRIDPVKLDIRMKLLFDTRVFVVFYFDIYIIPNDMSSLITNDHIHRTQFFRSVFIPILLPTTFPSRETYRDGTRSSVGLTGVHITHTWIRKTGMGFKRKGATGWAGENDERCTTTSANGLNICAALIATSCTDTCANWYLQNGQR